MSFGTGAADQPIWLSYLYCQGTEESVADCFYYLPWDNGGCSSHSNDLAVSCVDGQFSCNHNIMVMYVML